ncbi:hypothetical protein [Gordonia sp. (in: high G+C Gram-positive bacteria)]|uniref:hypothetical protein n=1 Tax=Gordonia sp. (in: high G+C Gram-positive bacteria) TaxID=84139 RepID=UPI003C7349AF
MTDDPDQIEEVDLEQVEDPTDDASSRGLGKRGRRLWDALVETTTPEDDRVLIEEACRTADRLDRLNWACKRDGIIELVEQEGIDGAIQIEIGNALSEARQQGQALKNLLIEIDKRRDSAPNPGADDVLADL